MLTSVLAHKRERTSPNASFLADRCAAGSIRKLVDNIDDVDDDAGPTAFAKPTMDAQLEHYREEPLRLYDTEKYSASKLASPSDSNPRSDSELHSIPDQAWDWGSDPDSDSDCALDLDPSSLPDGLNRTPLPELLRALKEYRTNANQNRNRKRTRSGALHHVPRLQA